MKKMILFSFLILMIFTSCESRSGVSEAYTKYKRYDGVTSLTIPGWVVRMASRLGDVGPAERELLQSIDRVRILTIEDKELNARVNLHKEFYKKISQDSELEELMAVNDAGEQITIFGKGDEDMFSELIILVGGNDNAMIHVKGKLKPEMISAMASKGNNHNFFGFRN